jgi:cold shock CspA family protein
MSVTHFYGHTASARSKRARTLSRPVESGVRDSGRIVKLFTGQGYGFIRLANDREIYFHRSDIQQDVSINDFTVGDLVMFERVDDPVSGARALRVKPLEG